MREIAVDIPQSVAVGSFRPRGPWPFFVRDFEADTPRWSFAERWHYARLLAVLWERGGWLEDDDEALADAADMPRTRGWRERLQKIREKLCIHPARPGWVSQKRLLIDLSQACTRSERARDAGKMGGRPSADAPGSPVDDLHAEVVRICGNLPGHRKQRRVVADWVAAGHSRETIIRSVQQVLEKRGAAPASLNYFTPVIGQKEVKNQRALSGTSGVASTEIVPVDDETFEAYYRRIATAQSRAAADRLKPGHAPAWFADQRRRA